jgi:large subunit ribosomal protein L31
LHIESCQNCNPVYTGKAQGVATGDRINKFKERFAGRGK